MQDGIIKGTGNSRFLKSVPDFLSQYPTYESFVEALAAGTLPVDFNGINETGWQQLGTALNKGNLLSDETAAMLGLPKTATPNDAFASVLPTAIGDLRMTTRNSVGEKWLLANGATISSEQYPQYAEKSIFTFAGEAKENLFYVPTMGLNTMKPLQYVQGNLVCVTDKSIFYAATPDAVWQESVIIQPRENGYIRGFAYGNGFYVVCGQMISPKNKSCIWYSRDIQGPWTAADIHQPNVTLSQGEFVRFINGQFVLKTSETIDSNSNSFLYAAETPDAQWSHVPLDFNPTVYHILYEEKKYLLVSAKEVSGSYYMGLMCATTLNGPWEFKKIDTNQLGTATCFTRINGKYIVFIAKEYTNTSIEHVYFSDSLDGPWKQIQLPSNMGTIRDIVYDHGAYYAISASFISTTSPFNYYIHVLYSENLESWTQAYQAQVYTNPGFVGILPFKNYMLCSAKELNAPGKSGIRYYDTRLRKLPSVTANGGAKVFIQVK